MVGKDKEGIAESSGKGGYPIWGKGSLGNCLLIMVEPGDLMPDIMSRKQSGVEQGLNAQKGDGKNNNQRENVFPHWQYYTQKC